jgi:hypothetical protein
MADSEAVRAKRSRAHRHGDHSLCDPARCSALGSDDLPVEVVELLEALDAELDDEDRTVRALAFRLARLSAGNGPAAVSALRALGELLAAQRGSW